MIVETKQLISNQLKEMMRTTPMDKITVKELVDRCGISRQAFYYHYQDMLDVVLWTIHKDLDDNLQKLLDEENIEECIKFLIGAIKMQRPMIMAFIDSRSRDVIEKEIKTTIRNLLTKYLSMRHMIPETHYKEYLELSEFFVYGASGVILQHANDTEEENDMLVNRIYQTYLTVFKKFI